MGLARCALAALALGWGARLASSAQPDGQGAPWQVIHDAGTWPGVSGRCRERLRSLATCQVRSGLYAACSSLEVLNNSAAQTLLGCSQVVDPVARLRACQLRCMAEAGRLENTTVNSPCSPELQAMHGFTPGFNIFTIGTMDAETDLSGVSLMPFANVKMLTGPSTVQLGSPEKCVEVPSGQYCVLSGKIPLPGGGSKAAFTVAVGACLPEECPESELQAALTGLHGGAAARLGLHVQCGFVRRLGNFTGISNVTAKFLGWGGVPVEHIQHVPLTAGFVAALSVCGVILLLVATGTALQLRRDASREKREALQEELAAALCATEMNGHSGPSGRSNGHANGHANGHSNGRASGRSGGAQELLVEREGDRVSCLERFFSHWSLVRNCSSFVRLRPPEQNRFACMDAIRVFSMFQVIWGHSFWYGMFSPGFSNMERFAPPNGLLGSARFMLVPGCFYGVDSFFLLSGFLCAHGLQNKVFSKSQFKRPAGFSLMYVKFVLSRYFRLIPLETFCIVAVTNILPAMGKGVQWSMDQVMSNGTGSTVYHCYESAGGGDCGRYWWTNLLFIQNFDQYLGKCMGHTWYLAADMQIYLLAPLFSLVYGLNRKAGWATLALGLLVGIILPIALTVQYQFVPDPLLGGAKGFGTKVYMKPWCRLSPFFMGIGLAWLWGERLEGPKARFLTCRQRVVGVALSLLGVGLCAAAIYGRTLLYRGDLQECSDFNKNPAGKMFQYLWAGFSIPVWSLGLSVVMVLCFQGRFLPLFQPFLEQGFWQPLAKLTYAAYLIHTSVLILDYCERDSQLDYSGSGHAYKVAAFALFSMMAAFVLWVLVEKPLANLQMQILGGGSGD